ncbi:MerR family transcriptional regulator [Stenotrophomonas rhizophila]|uniref:MerR family transcriptional regulator n=1 Tax=Stenotrophomonas rhizophila TaxID=216778 RepID=UPI00201CB2C3|nr:MerR family transcriptional regulator [Stenotrophomonas rhizophila]UQY86184.1 MerR family transcriptional regulator [Stenotrophomonas rhizophila]
MKIGELAHRTGLAPSRIRFYERIGLLKTAERLDNGYRNYPEESVLALRLIATGQEAGFSLEELRVLLPNDLANWERGTLLGALRRKVEEIDAMQVHLVQSKANLVGLMSQIESKPQEMDCETNAQQVLSNARFIELGNTGSRKRILLPSSGNEKRRPGRKRTGEF